MLYEIVTTDEEVIHVKIDLDIEVWIDEYEAQTGKIVAEYDKVDEGLTGLESVTEYQRWWAA